MTLQERFLRYVKINTTSDENGQGCPSAACEWELARLLADEMRAMGVSNVRLDAHAYVYGEIPANCEHAPAIGLIAHMDTVDAVPGRDFHPRVVEYQGGDICLNAEKGIVLSEKDFPELSQRRGKRLICAESQLLCFIIDIQETLFFFILRLIHLCLVNCPLNFLFGKI